MSYLHRLTRRLLSTSILLYNLLMLQFSSPEIRPFHEWSVPNHLHVSGSDRRRAACGGLSVRHAHLGVESERPSSFSAVIPARIPAELTEAQGALSLLRATSDAHIHVKEHPQASASLFLRGWLGDLADAVLCCRLLYVASLSPTYAENSIPFIKASALLRQNGLQLQAPAAEQRLGCNRMDLPPTSGSDSAPQWPRAGNSKSFPPAAYT